MKAKQRFFQMLAVLIFPIFSGTAWAQVGTLTQTGDVTVCLNSTGSFGVEPTAGSTYAWALITGTGGAGTIIEGAAPNNLIEVIWTAPGTCTLQVIETNATCSGVPVTIQVTVLPVLEPGTASADQSICYNTVPDLLTATAPSGGNGSYTYQWQLSADGGTVWVPVPGENSLSYQPGALTETTLYRLEQTSGDSCGPVTTNSITITVQPQLITSPIWH